jgi:sulfide:quinone oxidoreductase
MLALHELAGDLVDVELLSPEPHFWYRPLSVAEPFDAGAPERFDLADMVEAVGASHTPGELSAVYTDERIAQTSHGLEIPYDALVVASGAAPTAVLPGALTFRGPSDVDQFRDLLAELETGTVKRVAFALPKGVVWPLPLYELALLTAGHLAERGVEDVELFLVTNEHAPLELFGRAAGEAVGSLLDQRGIATRLACYPASFESGTLRLVPTEVVAADRVVALPQLRGRPIEGIPHDADGFISTDQHGAVRELENVYAAGDITTFPVKQGGISTQQADAVAEVIAARAGADVEPRPFDPVLRGLLLTGTTPTYMRAELRAGRGDTSTVAPDALWWPPAKIAGRYLAPFLASYANLEITPPVLEGAIAVETQLAATT